MARVLFTGTKNASSWSFRAWLALKEGAIRFEEHLVDIRRPQRFANLDRVGVFAPPASVPVLTDDNMVIFDSLAIMEYANDLAGGMLLPSDRQMRARARSFLSWQHAGLSGICGRLSFESVFYPQRRSMTAVEVAEARRFFVACDDELKTSGGPHLGGALSLADLAFVPTVLRLAAHDPHCGDLPRVRAWVDALAARPSVKEWMSQASELPPVFHEEYAG